MATGPGSRVRPRVRPLGAAAVVGVALSVALLAGAPAHGATSLGPRVRVDLVSEVKSLVPGATFWVGARQRIAAGTVGKMYGATNTPHMYVIDPSGKLVYAGAIDDRPTSRKGDVAGANNYVRAALQAVAAGQPVKTPVTRAYGCTVKYL